MDARSHSPRTQERVRQRPLARRRSRIATHSLRLARIRNLDLPTRRRGHANQRCRTARDGWDLVWRYTNLISGFQIGLTLAGQISYFAPVSLLLFFFLIFIVTTLPGIDRHPGNYFFLATAFFAFHLLLAYLVDHISLHLAFLICSAVSIFLVVSYLRIVVGPRSAWLEAGGAQFIYPVLSPTPSSCKATPASQSPSAAS